MISNDRLESWMENAAELLGLHIPAVCRAGVLENLRKNFAIADELMQLEVETEVSPVFVA